MICIDKKKMMEPEAEPDDGLSPYSFIHQPNKLYFNSSFGEETSINIPIYSYIHSFILSYFPQTPYTSLQAFRFDV